MIDISKDLTPEFFKNKAFKVGSVLMFEKGHYRITRLNRKKRICEVEPTKLYTEDEINAMPREEAERIIKTGKV